MHFYLPSLRSLLLCMIAVIPLSSLAERLDEDQARQAAAEFLMPQGQSSRLQARARQFELKVAPEQNGYYAFDRPEGGFIIVADDDAVGYTVLGYSDNGSFDRNNMPLALQDWCNQISVLMDAVHADKLNREVIVRKEGKKIVSPLISTHWNQGTPYNCLCPMLDGERCITGCVATAMAQVLKYWEWPKHGYGSVEYYDIGCKQTLSMDFSKNTYRYDLMKDDYYSNVGYTALEKTAIGTLLRDCGYAVQMHYTPTESSAGVSASTMQQYFHYGPLAIDRSRERFQEDEWHGFIREDLDNHRPVLYNGQSDTSGHEFILDGYDDEGYFHVNWGWGGYQDGWFILTDLNNFNTGQWMINELEPEYNESTFSYTLEDSTLTINGGGSMTADYCLGNAPWTVQHKSIKRIIIGEGITSLPYGFGYYYDDNSSIYYDNLKEVVLPEGLLVLGVNSFVNAKNLSHVTLPSTLKRMDHAFWSSGIEDMHIPANVQSYFDYIPYLTRLTVDDTNPYLTARDNILFNKDLSTLILAPAGLSRVEVPSSVSYISDHFILDDHSQVIFLGETAPALPEDLKNYPTSYIRSTGILAHPYVSSGYNDWTSILPDRWYVSPYVSYEKIPDFNIHWSLEEGTLKISGEGAMGSDYEYSDAPYYSQKSTILNLVVQEGVSELPWDGFYFYWNMTTAELPSTVAKIRGYCFSYTNLNSITCHARTAPSLGSSVFSGIPTSGTLRVPTGSDYSTWIDALPSGWTIEYFDDDAAIMAYLPTGEEKTVNSLKDWESLVDKYPNVMGLVSARYSYLANKTRNLLIADNEAEGGYRCPLFWLTDLTDGFNSQTGAPLTGFVSPKTFTAELGRYDRKFYEKFNTICVPFAFTTDDLPKYANIYTYNTYDEETNTVKFDKLSSTQAGRPYFIESRSEAINTIDLAGRVITNVINEGNANMCGTFTTTDAYKSIGYSPRKKDSKFAPLADKLHPFRACFLLDGSTPSEVQAFVETDEDALKAIKANAKSDAIYTIDGRRVENTIEGHLYIINGKIIQR